MFTLHVLAHPVVWLYHTLVWNLLGCCFFCLELDIASLHDLQKLAGKSAVSLLVSISKECRCWCQFQKHVLLKFHRESSTTIACLLIASLSLFQQPVSAYPAAVSLHLTSRNFHCLRSKQGAHVITLYS